MKVIINGNRITKSTHSIGYNEELRAFVVTIDMCKFSNKNRSFDIHKSCLEGSIVFMEFIFDYGDTIVGNFMISALEDPKLNYFRLEAQSSGEVQYIEAKS